MATGGEEILKARVVRMYPDDESLPNEDIKEVSIFMCIILNVHYKILRYILAMCTYGVVAFYGIHENTHV